MTILITGGAGFIGGHLAEFLQHRATVRILDNFRTGVGEDLAGGVGGVGGGGIPVRQVPRAAVLGVVFLLHLAALCSVFSFFPSPPPRGPP